MDLRSLTPFGRLPGMASAPVEDPFTAMRRQMDQMMETAARGWPMSTDAGGRAGFLSPRVNIAETEQGLELTAELPGIEQKDIALDLTDGVLTLRAEHAAETKHEDAKRYHMVERTHGSYLRRFALPFSAREDAIKAQFDKGVLTVLIPRATAAEKQPTIIPITGG